MTPLQRFKSRDTQLQALLHPVPSLKQVLDDTLPGPRPEDDSHVRDLLPDGQLRPRFHARLADYWSEQDAQGTRRRDRLLHLRHEQLLDEIALRLADVTLPLEHATSLRLCLELPHAWQRQHLPAAQRPQVYRPLLDIGSPHWRAYLPGALVIVATGPTGQMLDQHASVGHAVLCTLSHGIEAFASLAELHTEVCERLDDPLQREPMLRLCKRQRDRDNILLAERLRFDWFADNLLEEQLAHLLETQAARVSEAWIKAWNQDTRLRLAEFDAVLAKSMDLLPDLDSKHSLSTRYALLLEKHLPSWMRNSTPQTLTHIMQAMQALVIAVERAGAPGILTVEQFRQRNTLLAWTRLRLRERLSIDCGQALDPAEIKVSVTLARQIGPVINPLMPTGYIPAVSRPQVGDTVELLNVTYNLDELALLNIAWFDVDYWLTARVHWADGSEVEGVSPAAVRQMIRGLDAGSGYIRYLNTHLVDSPAGQWRQEAHGRISHARMQAEAVKARYAGHFLADPLEQGYRWVKTILHYPDSNWRATVEEHRISVRQLVIQGHTVQGVLLLNAEVRSINSFVVYAPDAPDRRPWREYRNTRHMLRSLRGSAALRGYVAQRMPLADATRIETMLLKGGLGPHVARPVIDGNLFKACYLAEVRALMSVVDQSTRSNLELLGETALNTLWLLLDLVSIALPSRPLSALAFGRAAISVINGLEALEQEDREEALDHAFNALSHTVDAINSFAGSTVMRQAMRGVPKPPSAPIPVHYTAKPELRHLRDFSHGQQGEGIFEHRASSHGLRQYYIQDKHGTHYQVAYDGQRWRAVDPRQPNAYLKVPVKRLENGDWVVDSPLLWYDGLPYLEQLFADCALAEPLAGDPVPGPQALYSADGQLYLQAGALQLPLRRHLLEGHYHLRLPATASGERTAWAVLRWQDDTWRIRLRQAGRASEWLALPALYPVIRGSS
ncbi:MAG TPA: DUF6543 domain-containing protein [Pseudomonas sp.]|uniref:dermonecrotic toxin domain-containing protein n=1 Tax=Pseudomonas sp. TaxID=306 RepID=UPI002B45A2FA|nr:DUF6543 domain-containing protein [Pseudomonas sp.]HKS11690.1 DUF6543 domain-containing protein [Pseudomonas sp.]